MEDVLRQIAKDNWTQTTSFVDGFLGPRMSKTEFFTRWPEIVNPSIRVDELRERWHELPLMRNMHVSELKDRWREPPFMTSLKTSELRGAYERGELARTAGRSLSDALLWEALQRVLMSTPAPKKLPRVTGEQRGFWQKQLQNKKITESELRKRLHPEDIDQILKNLGQKRGVVPHEKQKIIDDITKSTNAAKKAREDLAKGLIDQEEYDRIERQLQEISEAQRRSRQRPANGDF